MKQLFLLALLGMFAGVYAAETVLPTNNKDNLVYSKAEGALKQKIDNGVIILSIEKAPGEPQDLSNAQWAVGYSGGLTPGQYRAELTVKSSGDAKIAVNVMERGKPWTTFAQTFVNLKAGTAQTVTLPVEIKAEVKAAVRAPGLFLGFVPEGTTIEITDVKFIQITP